MIKVASTERHSTCLCRIVTQGDNAVRLGQNAITSLVAEQAHSTKENLVGKLLRHGTSGLESLDNC